MNFEERKRRAKGPDAAEAFGMMAKELFDYANGCGFPTEKLLIEHLHGLAQEHYSHPAIETERAYWRDGDKVRIIDEESDKYCRRTAAHDIFISCHNR